MKKVTANSKKYSASTKYLFADTLEKIPAGMFENSMLEVVFCPKVTEILVQDTYYSQNKNDESKSNGFEGCKQLSEINFPSLIKINSCCFKNCN
jgi:hypothetical protein